MFKNNEFVCVVHYAHDASGSGASGDDAKPIVSGAAFTVPEGVVVTDAHAIVDTAIAGATALTLGDGGDPDGYIAAAQFTLTAGVKVGAGALLNAQKYAAGDTVDLAVTGTSTAGVFQIVVRGYRV